MRVNNLYEVSYILVSVTVIVISLFSDYSCALQKDILVHGRIYITQSYICFYANIFRWETVVSLNPNLYTVCMVT